MSENNLKCLFLARFVELFTTGEERKKEKVHFLLELCKLPKFLLSFATLINSPLDCIYARTIQRAWNNK